MSDTNFVIVDATDDAKNLIFATWLRSYEASSMMSKLIPRDTFFAEHHRVLERIFARGPTVKLAVLPDQQDVVLGYAVVEGQVIHYVYVKPAFRRYGIAKALLGACGIRPKFTYTHHTYILRTDLHGKVKDAVFNPYKA